MPPIKPTSRRDLIRNLKRLGFDGPYPGGNHQFLVRDGRKLTLPNPHQSDIGIPLLVRILREAGVSREEWENL